MEESKSSLLASFSVCKWPASESFLIEELVHRFLPVLLLLLGHSLMMAAPQSGAAAAAEANIINEERGSIISACNKRCSSSSPSHTTSPDDLGYCRGSRKEKLAMLESKCRPQQQSNPDLMLSRDNIQPVRRTHSEDIKERVQLLEKAMSKANYTKDLGGSTIDKNHPEYGTPQKGTWTAMRGEKAHSHVHKVRPYANFPSKHYISFFFRKSWNCANSST